jgi:hypothetical protein
VENGVSLFRHIGIQALTFSLVKDSNGLVISYHPIISEIGHCNTPYRHKSYFSLQCHLDATVRLIHNQNIDGFRRLEQDHLLNKQS